MNWRKRGFDLILAVGLVVLLALPFALLLAGLWMCQGRPVFFVSKRMKTRHSSFDLWKLRTMAVGSDDGVATTGQKAAQITAAGRWLRRTRLDEVPQLWNILRGDMSFVGPRPPLPRYVALRPDLYGDVLRSRPGVTGLATLVYHRHEALLMQRAPTAAQAERLYLLISVPRKARLDMLYQRRASFCFDAMLLLQTLQAVIRK